MPVIRLRTATALLAAAAAGACTSRYRAPMPGELARPSGLVQAGAADAASLASEEELVRSFADTARTAYAAPRPAGARTPTFLALSGGGMYGAYTTGVLAGWSAAGDRPTFDTVTGVSTGAIIATYAFLGPEYDRRMVESYTSITDRDVYRRRPAPALLWSDSAADSGPLKALIASQVDDELLAAVAAAHRSGRRLYVGTTNLDTRRLVVWDMGAIAASGRPDAGDLYRQVLLASSSPPGFFPPVPIEVTVNGRPFKELHADGGATTGVFLRASTLNAGAAAGGKPLAGADAYVIVAGKLYSDPVAAERRAVKIAESGLQSLLYSQTRGELYRIYTLCLLGGMRYHLAAVPDDDPAPVDAMGFDPAQMRRLYELGYTASTARRAWRDTPPGALPHEQTRPRTGPDFLAPQPSR